ncbi:DUF7097 family protein [Halospeciosus flavus]|uniref:DUF7097 family protein n=1 Tax=Halospeciosus flavus TaxID=3032283 RepID=UPI003615D1BF
MGVEDPYEHAGHCDHVTGDGKCRYAFDFPEHDPEFAAERRAEEFACPAAAADGDGEWEWADCPHYRSTTDGEECARCGLEERRVAHEDERPLLEEHHLSYRGEAETGHEITVSLCRWCHAKVHDSWASVGDDANPDPEAIAAAEGRRSAEQSEFGFETAAERFDTGPTTEDTDGE